MASISTSSGGSVRIFFYDRLKKRRVIHLGRVPNSDAEAICRRIERFLNSQILGNEPTRADSEWLAKSGLAKKFAIAGIIEPQDHIEHSERMTVEEFLQSYVNRRGPTVKPATRVVWTQVIENLKSFLPDGIYLDELTVGHAKEVYAKLKAKMRPSTVSKRIGFCRQFFNDAVDWKKMKFNPFLSVKAPRPKAKVNEFVPRDEINRVMAKANTRWKVIIALARYGGLRTPSETLSLKWSHVDWENNRLHIPEPKVEHHEGRGVRQCPLFPELRSILEEAWDLYGDSSEYVVDAAAYRAAAMKESGWQNANLRTQLLKLLEKAGVDPWPRLFHSLRASRQTELEKEFPTYVVCAWLGNSEKIAKESYLLVTEDHFATATAKRVINPTQFVAERVINPTPQGARTEHANQHFAKGNIDETAVFPRLIITVEMENRGLEQTAICPGLSHLLGKRVINPTQENTELLTQLLEDADAGIVRNS